MKKCMNKYGYTKSEMNIFAIAFGSLLVLLVGYIIKWSANNNDSASTVSDIFVITGSIVFLISAILSLALACRRYMRNNSKNKSNNSEIINDATVNN